MMGYSRGAAVSSEPGAGQEGRAKATEVGGQHRRHTRRGSSYFLQKQSLLLLCCKSQMEETSYCVLTGRKLQCCMDGQTHGQMDRHPAHSSANPKQANGSNYNLNSVHYKIK